MFLSVLDLSILFEVYPHQAAVFATGSVSNEKGGTSSTSSSSSSSSFPTGNSSINSAQSFPEAPIVNITIGPNSLAPSLVVITTLSGEIYMLPLLDFIKWEKIRTPSALSQLLVSASAALPLQAVKGTIQQAQNFISSTSETASAIAANARLLADDALGELKNKVIL